MKMMRDKYVLISGSASRSCPKDKLDTAIKFVRIFTQEVLKRGGGVVVLAGREESTKNEEGTPRIFDWVALREVQRYAERTIENPRKYARIVMSDEAQEDKIENANLELLTNLEQRNVVEVIYIRREMFTGGEYREIMTEIADAMVAVGGGKGTYSTGAVMTELGKPVLPVDLRLGSITEDGEGAVALHREMMSDLSLFLPSTHLQMNSRIALFSLDRGINEVGAVGRTVAEILEEELKATPSPKSPVTAKRRLTKIRQLLKEIPKVAGAIKILEFLRGIFPFMQM